tara:strand:- start:395 stop:601 length:207 start_codon:yes stop_codon:yes gene_type:complete
MMVTTFGSKSWGGENLTVMSFFMGMGVFLTLVLLVLRIRFFWWPLHPAGYLLAVSFAIDYFWFPFFIS